MSDTTDAPATAANGLTTTTGTTTTGSPATTAFDPKAFEASIAALIDERVKGFQRIISERDNRLAELERQLKTANMSEEEREQQAAREQKEAEEALRLENELLKLGREYPREVEIVQKMLQGESVTDYVSVLHEAFQAVQPATPEPEQEVSDVDRNNPPSTPVTSQDTSDMIRLPDGRLITREEGLELLKQARSLYG